MWIWTEIILLLTIKRDKNSKINIKSVYNVFKMGNAEFIVQVGICMDGGMQYWCYTDGRFWNK